MIRKGVRRRAVDGLRQCGGDGHGSRGGVHLLDEESLPAMADGCGEDVGDAACASGLIRAVDGSDGIDEGASRGGGGSRNRAERVDDREVGVEFIPPDAEVAVHRGDGQSEIRRRCSQQAIGPFSLSGER